MSNQSASDSEELRLLYQVTIADLPYFKTQQWSVTYYCLLIDGGLIGAAQLLKPGPMLWDKILLSALVLLAAGAALTVLSKLQASIDVRRERLEVLRETFGVAFRRAWSSASKKSERVHSIYLLFGGVILTALLSLWLIDFRLGAA
jgi:hypothetical protein